jgi:hypothetical protein
MQHPHRSTGGDEIDVALADLLSERTDPSTVDVRRVEHLLDDAGIGFELAYRLLIEVEAGGEALDQLRRECAGVSAGGCWPLRPPSGERSVA